MTKVECLDCAALPYPGEIALGDGHIGLLRPAKPRPIDPRSTPRRPRCTTHWRAADKARKAKVRSAHKHKQFGLDAQQQQALWELQGCACPCGAKAAPEVPAGVALDHDHDLARAHDHDEDKGCPRCVTGFLCLHCNREIVGKLTGRCGRLGAETALVALSEFLADPPARRLRAAS